MYYLKELKLAKHVDIIATIPSFRRSTGLKFHQKVRKRYELVLFSHVIK